MKSIIWDFAKTIVLALVIALCITSFIKPTLVKGYSMYPTIEPSSYMIVNKIPYLLGTPQYGDIVVFHGHVYLDGDEEKDYIKRIIGLPGDTLEIREGLVYRNDEALYESYLYEGGTPGQMEAITVAEGCVFVMGDNRARSLDSRDPSIGQVDMVDIMGKVVLRLYPFDQIGFL